MPIPQDYKTVTERIADFKAKHPEGCLRLADPTVPYRIEEIAGMTYVVVVAAAFRHPEDPAPGIGVAWELVPGPTNFTKDSELQNAETSAWGRAIVAVLASESKHIASQEDIRNREPLPVTLDDSWKGDAALRDAELERLKAATDALPEAERADVVKAVTKAKIDRNLLTVEQVKWWDELIALASPKGSNAEHDPVSPAVPPSTAGEPETVGANA